MERNANLGAATRVLGLCNARYQVRSQPIGQGGMGVVYKAYDIMTKRDVALKTMRGSLGREALELFAKEWTVLAQVSHPNKVEFRNVKWSVHGGLPVQFAVKAETARAWYNYASEMKTPHRLRVFDAAG